jgi:predicted site-specific integrase-resolvase
MIAKEIKRLWTAQQVADFINIKPCTVYSWSEQGIIPSYKINGALRFDEDEIRGYVKQCKAEASYNNLAGRKTRKGG